MSARLDVFVTEQYSLSRSKAKELIENGGCAVNGKPCRKPSYAVEEGDAVELLFLPGYVSRGAHKLEKALNVFGIEVSGLICADVGSSTGGFTDLLLKRGARLVYAIDSGSGQLDVSLCGDARVISMENTNFRDVDKLPEPIEFLAADVSFISLTKLMPNIRAVMKDGVSAVLLIKPQFEAGRGGVGKSGVVRDRREHVKAIGSVVESASANGLAAQGLCYSPVTGKDGNIEYLLHVSNSADDTSVRNIKSLVDEAFAVLA